MDAARAVLSRLERIELLEAEGADARHLLAEVRALLVEADAWVREERGAAAPALDALDRCERTLAAERAPAAVG